MGFQDSFLRPPQGSVPGSGLSGMEGVPVQMRRPMPGEFTGIRTLPAPNAHPHMPPGEDCYLAADSALIESSLYHLINI